jgi:two-component system, OmpR family, sensor kinase
VRARRPGALAGGAARATGLARRLAGVQLRLRVLAGVVAVTLIALAAFDVGAITVMRRYLLGQTDRNLGVALNLAVPRLAALRAAGLSLGPGGKSWVVLPSRQAVPSGPLRYTITALPGAFDLTFLPRHGRQVTLQVSPDGPHGAAWVVSPTVARVAARPGAHTVVIPRQLSPLRIQSAAVPGGSLVAGTSLSQVTTTIDQVEAIVAFGSLAVVLLIGLGVFAVLRRGLRPIEAMARQADRISGGDLAPRVTLPDPRSEVGRLGAALNGMLARIEADVAEREASQQHLRRFFADASHELRNPLASLRANAELYQQGAVGSPEDLDEVMERIAAETRRMGTLVDDMLRLARLGQQPGRDRVPVDLTAVVTGCAERVRRADPARAWQVRIAGGLATVGDEELLRRAVDNLLMNVLVHTPGETAGTISAAAAGEHVIIEVGDDGPGVPAAELPHVFERFYRAGVPAGRPGAGLGLAIAAEIISAHGGTAQAALARPHGLRITLAVPASPRGPGAAPELAAAGRALTAGGAP